MIDRPLLEHALLVGDPSYGELILVRHAQQENNPRGDPARPKWADTGLTDLGRRQAEAVAAVLSGRPIDAVYCSALARAIATAACIAEPHGLTPVVDEALCEIGVYRDVPAEAAVADVIGPEGMAAVRTQFLTTGRWEAFPFSEGAEELAARVSSVTDAILRAHPEGSRVVIVCHAGIINAIIRRVLGVEADIFFYPAHASISRVARGEGRMALRSLNEEQHLRLIDAVTY